MTSTARVSNIHGLALPPGYKFHPTDEELLGYYLYNKVWGKPFKYEYMIPQENLYDKKEPWDLWYMYEGPNLHKSEDLYFFTELKKVSEKGSRVARRVGFGTWKGQNSGNKISYYDSLNRERTLGLCKSYTYENKKSDQHNCWIMHEYSLNPLLMPKSSTSNNINVEYVLCRIRKNDRKKKLSDDTPSFENKVQRLENMDRFGAAEVADDPNEPTNHVTAAASVSTDHRLHNEQEQNQISPVNSVQDYSVGNFLELQDIKQGGVFDGSIQLSDFIDLSCLETDDIMDYIQQQQPAAPIYEQNMIMEIGESHTSTQRITTHSLNITDQLATDEIRYAETTETLQQPDGQPDGIFGDAMQYFATESLRDDKTCQEFGGFKSIHYSF